MIMTSFIKSFQSINQSPHSWSRTGYISRALHFSQPTPCFPIQDGRMDQFVEPCSSLHNILSHKSTPKTEDSRFECSGALSSAWPLASDKSSSAVNQISHIPNNPLQWILLFWKRRINQERCGSITEVRCAKHEAGQLDNRAGKWAENSEHVYLYRHILSKSSDISKISSFYKSFQDGCRSAESKFAFSKNSLGDHYFNI